MERVAAWMRTAIGIVESGKVRVMRMGDNMRNVAVTEGDKVEAGKKSVAITVTLQPVDRTLTDDDLEKVAGRIVAAVIKATGGVLRA